MGAGMKSAPSVRCPNIWIHRGRFSSAPRVLRRTSSENREQTSLGDSQTCGHRAVADISPPPLALALTVTFFPSVGTERIRWGWFSCVPAAGGIVTASLDRWGGHFEDGAWPAESGQVQGHVAKAQVPRSRTGPPSFLSRTRGWLAGAGSSGEPLGTSLPSLLINKIHTNKTRALQHR